MNTPALTRRGALTGAAGLGLSISFMGRAAYAAAEGGQAKRKLVIIVCRGAMDGLSVSPPVGDPNYAALRGAIAIAPFGAPKGALKLDDTFGLHQSLASVHSLAEAGQARIVPAVATTDRARSHFEAQDVLESGGPVVYGANSGWLNRTLQALAPAHRVKAMSVGAQAPLILRGSIETASWSPGGIEGRDARLPGILMDLYAKDPLLGPALASGLGTETMAKAAIALANADAAAAAMPVSAEPVSAMAAPAPSGGGPKLNGGGALQGAPPAARKAGDTIAKFMLAEDGPQIVAISLDNFDTHANQAPLLTTRLLAMDALIDGLHQGLGVEWRNTVVVAATEFGRTAHVNGTGGTDHGTASTALVLGGGLKRRGIIGDWPTLAPGKLFEARDTAPTLEMRALFKGVLVEHLSVDRRALDTVIFPDSGGVAPATGVVA